MVNVSVVIPCFNQGAYLNEAIDSVLAQTYQDLEIIVVNDGSTDQETNDLLSNYARDKTTVITTDNQGLAAARNNGIEKAKGTYILPLDADDLIAPRYIEQGVAVLEADQDVGIVYCKAMLFGDVEGEWNLPPYSFEEMLKDNIIFCTALFRKSDWAEAGGYDTGMIYGWEDYEFWLSLLEKGRKVKKLPDCFFYYRVASNSMVRSKDKWQKVAMFKRIYNRHHELIGRNIEVWLEELLDCRKEYYLSKLYIDCGNGIGEKDSVSLRVDPGTKSLHFEIGEFSGRKMVRFDPVDCPVCLKINTIECIGNDFEETFETDIIKTNALFEENGILMFDTDDPQIFFQLKKQTIPSTLKVIIKLDFLSFGQDALRDMIERFKNKRNHSGWRGKIIRWFTP